ncbi:hypothetical protein Tco_1001062, partial [Tanacetum coccineum]
PVRTSDSKNIRPISETSNQRQPARICDPKNIRPRYETTPEHRVRRRHALHTDPTILHNPNEQGASAPNCVRWAGAPTITNSANAPSRGSRGSQFEECGSASVFFPICKRCSLSNFQSNRCSNSYDVKVSK